MMIEHTNQLNDLQLNQLMQLKVPCKQKDESVPNVYPHILAQPRAFPVNLLYYDQSQLIGFLSVFFFYDDAVEISLLIAPKSRRKGIATQLLQSILPLIQSQHISTLIFSSPSHRNSNWLKGMGFTYLHSEYYMERDDLNPLLDCNQTLTFREASIQDITVLCAIDDACFPKTQGKSTERFQQIFDDRNYQVFMAYQNNQPIGKAHLRWENQGVTLSDIAVLPKLQGKGFGSALISHCINYALSEGKPNVNLDVETHNQRALNLYTRLGFHVQNACDYWSIELNKLQEFPKLKHSEA